MSSPHSPFPPQTSFAFYDHLSLSCNQSSDSARRLRHSYASTQGARYWVYSSHHIVLSSTLAALPPMTSGVRNFCFSYAMPQPSFRPPLCAFFLIFPHAFRPRSRSTSHSASHPLFLSPCDFRVLLSYPCTMLRLSVPSLSCRLLWFLGITRSHTGK